MSHEDTIERKVKELAEDRLGVVDKWEDYGEAHFSDVEIKNEDVEIKNDVVTTDYYSGSSEQSPEDISDQFKVLDQHSEDYRFFIGQDNKTLWISQPMSPGKVNNDENVDFWHGPKSKKAKRAKTHTKAFNLFITHQMIDDIVTNTNIHIAADLEYARDRVCQFTSKSEINALLGVLILIGNAGHSLCSELWDSDGTGLIILRSLFSYKRFRFLLRSLKFDNVLTRIDINSQDPLAPIRDFHWSFINNCIRHYNLGKFAAIDEMLVPFKGRSSFARCGGIKMYSLCDSNTCYTQNLEIHCAGSDEPRDIVTGLIEPIENTQRNITVNSHYGSYSLAGHLLTKGLTFLCTLKKHEKEIPSEFLPGKRKRNGHIFGFQDDFCLVSTKAKIFLSTMHHTCEIDANSNETVVSLDYNATKGAVKSVDQTCASYGPARVTKRWTLAVFFRFLDIAGINAYVIYKCNNPEEKVELRQFLKNLSLRLMRERLEERALIRTLPKDIYYFLTKYRTEEEGVARSTAKPGICFVCGSHKNNRTKSVCNVCGRNVCKKHSSIIINCLQCDGKHDHIMDIE